jgi:quinol monooxygenase YgiN
MKFTMENEIDNKINFLDIMILKETGCLSFSIYRKPSTTDTIIPSDSYAAKSYLTNRMNTYNLNAVNKEMENSTIKHIL